MPASSPPSAGRSHNAAPLPAGSHLQSEPRNEPEHKAPRSSSPGPCRLPTKAICCRSFTLAQPDCPAASVRDFLSGAYTQYPQRAGRASVQPAPSALGVRLPAQVRGLPEPDRALVEDPALLGAEGPPLRDLGRDRARRRTRNRLLERAQTSLHLGPSPASSDAPPSRPRRYPSYLKNLADAPLRGRCWF